MSETLEVRIIAHMETDFPTKFGLPKQSGIAPELTGRIVFCPEYRQEEAFRGLEGYSHIWIVWDFSMAHKENWSATVKPPRLGGKTRMGVFATRSPYRPNPIGLSCVSLERIEYTKDLGPVLHVSGVDMMDGTPIIDIKPYLPYADAHPEALSGFAQDTKGAGEELKVVDENNWLSLIPEEKREGARKMLSLDPRPPYHSHPEQIYKIAYAGYDIRFRVSEEVLVIVQILSADEAREGKMESEQ